MVRVLFDSPASQLHFLVMSRGSGKEKVIHYMPYINQALLIIQYLIHYTKGVTEELYIALYNIAGCTRYNEMCVENEKMRGTPH